MKTSIRSIVLVVACLAGIFATTHASAIYDPGTGRFLQRDNGGSSHMRPGMGYQDGMNQYAAHFVQRGGLDPSGNRLVYIDIPADGDAPPADGSNKGKYIDQPDFKKNVDAYKKMVAEFILLLSDDDKISDAQFRALVRRGRVKWDGEKFNGTKQDFMNRLGREMNGTHVLQQRYGTAGDAADKLEELVGKDKEPWDQFVISVHGNYENVGPRHVYNGTVNVHGKSQDGGLILDTFNLRFKNLDIQAQGIVASCGQTKGLIERISLSLSNPTTKDKIEGEEVTVIYFDPIKMKRTFHKRPDGPAVDPDEVEE